MFELEVWFVFAFAIFHRCRTEVVLELWHPVQVEGLQRGSFLRLGLRQGLGYHLWQAGMTRVKCLYLS